MMSVGLLVLSLTTGVWSLGDGSITYTVPPTTLNPHV